METEIDESGRSCPQERDQQDRAFGLHIPGLEVRADRRSQSVGTGETETRKTGSSRFSQMVKDLEHGAQRLRVYFLQGFLQFPALFTFPVSLKALHCSGASSRSICPSICHVGADVLGRWARHLLSWFLTAASNTLPEHSGLSQHEWSICSSGEQTSKGVSSPLWSPV